jgi:hypothetical protein
MALHFKVETQTGHLLMIYEGRYEPSLAEEFTNQIVETSRAHQPTKLLIDLREVTGEMSTMDRFNLSRIAVKKYFLEMILGKIPKCRYAIVGRHPLVDPRRFEEIVATNRGMNVKTFAEIRDAYAWLGVEPPGEKLPS